MKKLLLVSILVSIQLILSSNSLHSRMVKQEDFPILDSAIVTDTAWTFRFYDGDSHRQTRSIFFYDSWGNMIDDIYQGWDIDSNNYFSSERWSQEYNSKKQMLVAYSYGYKYDWFYKEKEYYYYSEDGKLIEEKGFMWDGTQWVTYSWWQHKYDKNGNEIETIYQFWKENNWKKVSRIIYTYDDKNRVLTQLNYNNSEDNWKENQKSEWEYIDTVSSVITYMMYDKWTPNDKSVYTYNSQKLLIYKENFLLGQNWNKYTNTVNYYNDLGLRTHYIYFVWNIPENKYDTLEKREFLFNDQNKVIRENRYSFSSNGYSLYYYIINAYKKIITDVKYCIENLNESVDCKIYPNPTADFINLNLINDQIKEVKIIDLMGNQIFSKKYNLNSEIVMSTKEIPQGKYLIFIEGKNDSYIKKFIKAE